MNTVSDLVIQTAFSGLFRKFIPKSNIVFLGFCNGITTPYGKDVAGGLVSDQVFLPSIIRKRAMEFSNVPYLSFNTSSKLHIAGGLMLNIVKYNGAAFVDKKLEIADVRYHVESMITNSSIDAIEFIDKSLMSLAIAGANPIVCSNGKATGKTYGGAKITERSIIDEIYVDGVLKGNEAKFVTSRVAATTGIGTQPIPLAFVEITSEKAGQEIQKTYMSTGEFVASIYYADSFRSAEAINMQRCELGYIRGSTRRIYTTTNYPSLTQSTVDGGTDKVYSSLVFGQSAFSVYLPSNRLVDIKLQSNVITDNDTNAEKIRLSMKLTTGITQDIYMHSQHLLYLGAQ